MSVSWAALSAAGAMEGAAFTLWQAQARQQELTEQARIQAEMADIHEQNARLTMEMAGFAERDAVFAEFDAEALLGQAEMHGELADMALLRGEVDADMAGLAGRTKMQDAFKSLDRAVATTIVEAAASGVEMVGGTTSAAIVERAAELTRQEVEDIEFETEVAAGRARLGGMQNAMSALESKFGLARQAAGRLHEADRARAGRGAEELRAKSQMLDAARSRLAARSSELDAFSSVWQGEMDYRNTMTSVMRGMMGSFLAPKG